MSERVDFRPIKLLSAMQLKRAPIIMDKTLIFSVLIFCASSLSNYGAILVSYEFTGTTAAEVSPTTESAEVTASGL
jgi:hypothetical protein